MQTNTLAVTVLPAGKGNLTVNIGKRTIPFPFRSFTPNRVIKDNAAVEGVETSVLKTPYPRNQGGGWQLKITVGAVVHDFWVNDDGSKVELERDHRNSMVQAWAESKPDGLLAELAKSASHRPHQHHRPDNRGKGNQGNRPTQPQNRQPQPPRQPQHSPPPPQSTSGRPAPVAKAPVPPRPAAVPAKPVVAASPTPMPAPAPSTAAATPEPAAKPADKSEAAVVESPAPAGGKVELTLPNNCTAVIRVTVTENPPGGNSTGESRTEAQAIVRETPPAAAVVAETQPLNSRVALFQQRMAKTQAAQAAAARRTSEPVKSEVGTGDQGSGVVRLNSLAALTRSDLKPGT